jgi:hypothetical protein
MFSTGPTHCGPVRYGQGPGEPNQSLYSAIYSVTNLLECLPKLTQDERKLITEAMRRYDPEKLVIDYNNVKLIALLNRDRVVPALWLYGTTAAIDLALELRGVSPTAECRGPR